MLSVCDNYHCRARKAGEFLQSSSLLADASREGPPEIRILFTLPLFAVGSGHIPKAMNMKRGIAVFLSVGALVTVGYFTASKWAIRHESFTFYDPDRENRPVAVDMAIRWDKQMKADAGMIKLPVVVFSHGNTVKSTEYSFINNLFAAHGYMVLSIQHDLPNDTPMVTKPGEPYVGRLPQILRGVANIKFAVQEMQKVAPNADYDRLTVAGHSMGGDITMYFATQYPDRVKKVVTLDNLRVPFITSGKFKILELPLEGPAVQDRPRRDSERAAAREGGHHGGEYPFPA